MRERAARHVLHAEVHALGALEDLEKAHDVLVPHALQKVRIRVRIGVTVRVRLRARARAGASEPGARVSRSRGAAAHPGRAAAACRRS